MLRVEIGRAVHGWANLALTLMTSLRPPDALGRFSKHGYGRSSLSRSPHPYHRRSGSVVGEGAQPEAKELAVRNAPHVPRSSSPSDSGTEADDEKGPLLRGLPAPPPRPRKGLKSDAPYIPSPIISPLPTPFHSESEHRRDYFLPHRHVEPKADEKVLDQERTREKYFRRRRTEIVRRGTETVLLFAIGVGLSYRNAGYLSLWMPEIKTFFLMLPILLVGYPLGVVADLWKQQTNFPAGLRRSFRIPSRFDLGSILYPLFLPGFVALSLAPWDTRFFVPNLILGLSSLPSVLLPSLDTCSVIGNIHWGISVIPLGVSRISHAIPYGLKVKSGMGLPEEYVLLLPPLQHALMPLLHYLTTTSLDLAELKLLATALVNVLVFSNSPEMQILKGLLWLGGISLFVSCSSILSWELALARIPSWKFRGRKAPVKGLLARLDYYVSEILAHGYTKTSEEAFSDDEDQLVPNSLRTTLRRAMGNEFTNGSPLQRSTSVMEGRAKARANGCVTEKSYSLARRRNTLSSTVPNGGWPKNSPPTGRVKRSILPPGPSFLSLSPAQAQVRKWLYASEAYIIVVLVIMLPVRRYIEINALASQEPFGWAVGYLFGNISRIRFLIVSNNLERWIKLPSLERKLSAIPDGTGWIERLRQTDIGPANMRLLISGYCVPILVTGITIVLQLTSIVEVDTRRKVFHGIMVAMLLPTVFVDPSFISLALVLMLAIFLLLDLFRASQLPPISRPLTHFLAPYVDGRDHRGPVIVSHVFLLIGCAIPLWLSLAGLPRAGESPWTHWDVSGRDLSMISGIICVGMGDSAASLVGRRYGRTKWYWGGGKSLEGSAAFASAVTLGLSVGWLYLRLGGWVSFDQYNSEDYCSISVLGAVVMGKCLAAGVAASILEATLTAANDNVVVPIGLWLVVRVLDI